MKIQIQEANAQKSRLEKNSAKLATVPQYNHSNTFNDLNVYIPRNSILCKRDNSVMFKGNSSVSGSLFWKMWTTSSDPGVNQQ